MNPRGVAASTVFVQASEGIEEIVHHRLAAGGKSRRRAAALAATRGISRERTQRGEAAMRKKPENQSGNHELRKTHVLVIPDFLSSR